MTLDLWAANRATSGSIADEVSYRLKDVVLCAPICRPFRNIICVGKNYRDHAHEFARSGYDTIGNSQTAIPTDPIVFTKPPQSVIATEETIRYPSGISEKVDYEAELAVVIGKVGKSISRKDAERYVWGYTIVNDVTARDLQATHSPWFLGKGLDTFCPMGPWIVTADEVGPDPTEIQCWVNGELRQKATTKDLIFDIPKLIETISRGMTLYPGDVIATGTPHGVGIGFSPPKFLKPGDRVSIEIDRIGRLENPIG